MDDEEAILEIYDILLAKMGHTTVCTASVADALAAFKEAQKKRAPFDVVVLDLNMGDGDKGGREALAAMRILDPGIRAIVSSGLSAPRMAIECSQHGFNLAISKPFRAQDVVDAFKKISDQ